MTSSLFISDLHLSEATPQFEAWIGDDDDSEIAMRFADAMKKLADRGTAIFFMRGNRDFLVGEPYLKQFNAELLGDTAEISVAGSPALLMHGDLLCTDDVDYMAFRALAHNPDWQAEMLAKPLTERRELAKHLRAMSKEAASNKAEDIMDVNQDAVSKTMQEHRVKRLIHGHTHRPFRHAFQDAERVVLGDWSTTGWYLLEHDESLELVEFNL